LTDKATTIHDLELNYQEFRGPLERLHAKDFSEVWLGDWSVDELLAHMAGWFREMEGAIKRVEKGERPTPEGVDYSDSDAWNAKFTKDAKHGTAALNDFDNAYESYLAAAKSLPPDKFGVDDGRPRIGNRLLQASGIGHFREHQEQLDEWLAERAE